MDKLDSFLRLEGLGYVLKFVNLMVAASALLGIFMAADLISVSADVRGEC